MVVEIENNSFNQWDGSNHEQTANQVSAGQHRADRLGSVAAMLGERVRRQPLQTTQPRFR
jgi:hypothetical protein